MIIKKNKDSNKSQPSKTPAPQKTDAVKKQKSEVEFDEADFFTNVSLKERNERRRGDRRRGYRRIDDRKLVSRAQEEAVIIKEKASKEGYQKGIRDAQLDIQKLKEDMSVFLNCKEDTYKEISKDILDISVEIARKIIKHEVSADKSILIDMIVDVLNEAAKSDSKIVIKVSGSDVEYVKSFMPNILSNTQIEGKIHVMQDERINDGSAIIETSNGVIDATFDTQLALVKEMFKQI